jgi:4-aminobutyrate aminotransferase-like enzyme
VPPPHYLQRVRAGCDEHGVTLVIDETHAGIARTGALLAIEREKVTPDLVALSLAVAPGLDGGIVLARAELGITPALTRTAPAARATLAVLEEIERDRLVNHVKVAGKSLQQHLHAVLETRRKWAMDTRGRGLLHTLSLWDDPSLVIDAAARRGLRIARTGDTGLLFAPPLTATAAELTETFAVLDEVLANL